MDKKRIVHAIQLTASVIGAFNAGGIKGEYRLKPVRLKHVLQAVYHTLLENSMSNSKMVYVLHPRPIVS